MEFITNNQNIDYIKCNDKEHIKAVSSLHMKLLPESILSKLGFLFLSKFYYPKLIKNKSIEGYLYKQEKDYVGFIVCTNRPFNFMGEGIKKYFLQIILILTISIILNPRRIKTLLDYLLKTNKDSLMKKMQINYGNKMGEFLSFGVLENFRKNIDSSEKISIPNVLMKLVSRHFEINNKQYALLRILKTNTRAIQFYQKHAGVIHPTENPDEVVIIIQTFNNV